MLRIIKTSNYQERLVANKQRVREVAVGKRVETETAQVSVPIEKRVVVERVTQQTPSRAVAPGSVFVWRRSTHRNHEETPDIHKEALYVCEEVKVKKVVDQETVEAQETLRREELDVDTEGRSVVDGSNSGKTSQNQKKK